MPRPPIATEEQHEHHRQRQQHQPAEQEIQQIGGKATKGAGHAIRERDVLGRNDFDRRVNLCGIAMSCEETVTL